MKFRTTAIYFLILLVIGAAYGAMRLEKEKAARKKKESSIVFSFAPKTVSRIEIESGLNKPISLKKTHKWRILSPIASKVDSVQLTGLLSTLHHVEMQRKIGKHSGDLKDFGLDKPSLVVRFLTGGKWLKLEAGAQNPTQSGRYATAGKNGEVFLISNQAYDDLNKGLDNLRSKELFSWHPHQVKEFRIAWSNGNRLDIVRQGDTSIWKSKSQPGLKISADKVDNLLQALHWMRASTFLAKSAMPASADVDVTFELKDGKTRELKVVLPKPGEKHFIASSSEIPCPVTVSTYLAPSIPHSAEALVDHPLVSSKPSDIKKIAWKAAEGSGELVRMGGGKWGRVEGSATPKALKDSYPVQTFLAFVHNTEYIIGSAHSVAKPPQGAANSIHFTDVFHKNSSLSWNAPAPKSTGPVTAWLEKDGSVLQVQVKQQYIHRLGSLLSHMGPPKSKAPQKSGAPAKKG